MITRLFECREHPEYGGLGWAMVDSGFMDPLSGMAVAHDVLEHFPNDRGSVEEEFMALGASYFVRGDNYYACVNSNYDWAENMAGEFSLQYNYLLERGDGLTFRDPGRVYVPEEMRDDLDSLLQEGRKLLRYELDDEEYREFFSTEQQRRVVGWFSRGYRRARRRYRQKPAYMCELFINIQEAADKLLKRAIEGDRMKVQVSIKRLNVNVEMCRSEDDYY